MGGSNLSIYPCCPVCDLNLLVERPGGTLSFISWQCNNDHGSYGIVYFDVDSSGKSVASTRLDWRRYVEVDIDA